MDISYQYSIFDVLEALALQSVQDLKALFQVFEKEINDICFPYTYFKKIPKKAFLAASLIRQRMKAIEFIFRMSSK